MFRWPPKDPDATLPQPMDWSKYLKGDTIIGSTWTVSPAGPVQVSQSFTPTTTILWLSGGVHGQNYTLTNRITTASGITDERSGVLPVRNQ